MNKYVENTKKTGNKVTIELRKVWAMVQMGAMFSGAIALIYCAIKQSEMKEMQYFLASIAAILLFSVVWKIYLLLGDN